MSWVILIEEGYSYSNGAQALSHGGDGNAILSGHDGRSNLRVEVKNEGQILFVTKSGEVKEVPSAFKFGDNIFDVYSGNFDLERYPFLEAVNTVFEKDKARKKQIEQVAAPDS
ncbi:hypothetical protein HW115_19285 [Verrucomicrobiaceae bacterium N1E253]|uniref:Uncharacterized protein n=1 Tax=Oceaniferula marina TaxID=2748318 RepID=A0A851GPE2_9BACT|nr:hypothetical protein [Oceaniferula marina]NWK57771.1 hypothetical protein [Oceaniferula marina]